MKKIVISLLVLVSGTLIHAQDFSDDFRKVYDACMDLRMASVSGSSALMKSASTEIKAILPRYFGSLRCLDPIKPSLNGHFIFDYEFVDSLLVNKKVYTFAQQYAEREEKRGISSSKKIYMRTCCVGALSTSRYYFIAHGIQELAVVAEGDGLVNLRVYDSINKVWYNDTQDLNVGQASRTRRFTIPGGNVRLEIEVENKIDKDISFVIISN